MLVSKINLYKDARILQNILYNIVLYSMKIIHRLYFRNIIHNKARSLQYFWEIAEDSWTISEKGYCLGRKILTIYEEIGNYEILKATYTSDFVRTNFIYDSSI